MKHETQTVLGKALQVGDVLVGLWHAPEGRDRIVSLEPYKGSLSCFTSGAQIAGFAISSGMTIDNGAPYAILKRSA